MAEPLAYEGTGYEVGGEPPELLGRNLVSASYLLAGATAFFFIAFVFAYFYLRSLNNAGMWKPKGVDASVAWGTVVVACYAASAVLVRLGLTDHRALRRDQWRLKGLVALLPIVVGNVLNMPFGFGGTALLIVVGVALDTVQQVQQHLLLRHYDGFMKEGRIKFRGRPR